MTPTRISGPIHEAPPEYRILDSTDDCYLLIDEDYDVVWANLAFQQTFGTPEGDLKEIIYALGEDEDLVAWTFAVLDGSCEVSGIECRLSSTGGKEQRYLCSARKALPSDKGWLLQFREIRDITVPPHTEVLVAGNVLFIGDPEEDNLLPHAAIPIVASGKVLGSLNLVPRDHKPFTDADRSLLAAIGREIGSSIERILLIRQLEEAKREADLYLDILSHDIRNAENISGLYTDLLISTLEGEPKEYAQRIRSSIRKSIEILRNVSTIRRIHHESTVLVPIDLDEVIRNEIGIFSEIDFHYRGTELVVVADPLLSEVFTNLIGNAIKFGGPTVEVTIRVEEIDDAVLVSVEDTGPGIPDEVKETVFTRFGENRSRKSGQGLGLYITRMLIERYGGRIWVDDRIRGRPECGAALRLTLKRA